MAFPKGKRRKPRTKQHRLNLSIALKGVMKGRKLTTSHKQKIRAALLKKTQTSGMLGKKHTIESKRKISISCKGKKLSIETKQKIRDAQFNKIKISKEDIYKLVNTLDMRKISTKTQFVKNLEDIAGCGIGPIIRITGKKPSELLEYLNLNIVYNKRISRIGNNETNILQYCSTIAGYNILPQYFIAGKFLDGYIPKLNLAIEIDESHHYNKLGNLKIEDIIREDYIKDKLGCSFLRLKEQEVLKKIEIGDSKWFENIWQQKIKTMADKLDVKS